MTRASGRLAWVAVVGGVVSFLALRTMYESDPLASLDSEVA